MERQKRIYHETRSHMISAVMLALAALVVLSGLMARGTQGEFSLEQIPQQTAIPLEESFDETLTETIAEFPSIRWYALQVGVFENEESAKQASLVYQKRGAAGYLWQDGRYRVLAAAYPEKEDAQQVREQLRDRHNIDSYLYVIEFPALSMRLSGMRGQLDILQAAWEHANDLAMQIQEISVKMDRQELASSEAVAQLNAIRTQMELVALRLQQRFPAPVPATVQALKKCFEDYASFALTVSADESAASIGMKLKYQLFVTLQHIQSIYQTLNHT